MSAFEGELFFSFSDRKCEYLSVYMQDEKIYHLQVDVNDDVNDDVNVIPLPH